MDQVATDTDLLMKGGKLHMAKQYKIVILETIHIVGETDTVKELEVYEHQSLNQLKRRIGHFIIEHGHQCTVFPTYKYLVSISTVHKMGNYTRLQFTAIEEAS